MKITLVMEGLNTLLKLFIKNGEQWTPRSKFNPRGHYYINLSSCEINGFEVLS